MKFTRRQCEHQSNFLWRRGPKNQVDDVTFIPSYFELKPNTSKLKRLQHPNRISNYWRQYGIGNQKLLYRVSSGIAYPKTHGTYGLLQKIGMLQKAWSSDLQVWQEFKTSIQNNQMQKHSMINTSSARNSMCSRFGQLHVQNTGN